jgi:hypothetical protein
MQHISRAAVGGLAGLAIATGVGVCGNLAAPGARADPNDDPVLCPNHGCTRGPEGGQGEAAQQARAGAEHKYLADVHRIAPGLAKSDSQLVADGWKACNYRRAGHESINLPGVSAPEAAWALTDLCPEVGDF